VHEILEYYDDNYRFFMDIDTKQENINITTEELHRIISYELSETIKITPQITIIQKSDKSSSFHIYANFATTQSVMKILAKEID
jgi:hypothetical protein